MTYYRPLAFVVALVCASSTMAAADQKSVAAPADEYFGRMKMSIIGIRNELNVLDNRVTSDPVHADNNLKVCELVEDSLEEWAQKYPRDSWLQDAFSHLEGVYAHVASLEGKLHLARLVLWTHDHLQGTIVENSARAAAAKLFEVPMHSDESGPAPAASPDLLDPTVTPPPDAPAPAASPIP